MSIALENITFKYSNNAIFSQHINLCCQKGQITTIMGRSGCGKSTLLNLFNGTIKADSGVVKIGDKVCATIFQNKRLIPWQTIGKNIAFGAHCLGQKVTQKEVQKLLINVGLPSYIKDAYPKILSGGMKQRVALARALICKPDVLFMDEPFNALDISLKHDLMFRIANFIEQTQAYAIFVTHDICEACKISNIIYEMRGYPAKLRQIESITTPTIERTDTMIDTLMLRIKKKLRQQNIPKFSQYAFVKNCNDISTFIDLMTTKGWHIYHIRNEHDVAKYRPDLIVIRGDDLRVIRLVDKYASQTTRFLFTHVAPSLQGIKIDSISGSANSLNSWWGWDGIYQDLIDEVPKAKVKSVIIGHNWVFTQLMNSPHSGGGLARCPDRGTEGARTISEARALQNKNLRDLARFALSNDDLERAIGISAINAHYNIRPRGYTQEECWGFRPFRELMGEKVCIGHFPPASKILPDIKIIEREPKQGHYTVHQGEELIPKAQHLVITAQTLINGTLPRLLFLGQAADIMLLGPTTPLSDIWKKYGVHWACGVHVTHNQRMFDFVSQAGAMLMLNDQAQKITLEF